MQKVIGLDIGSYSIKAIEIVNTFKSYEIANFYETVIPPLDGVPMDAVVPLCMEQLFKENNLHADRIVTAMPGQFISSRILDFNFSDPRKIETSIMSELEDFVPFNMDDMIIDNQILGTTPDKKTMVLAVMTRKTFLKNFLDLLARIDIDPKLVDIDSLAFYNLSSHMEHDENKSVALIDVGHEKTSVCIVQNGLLRMFRSINLGGRYITDFLARDLELDFFEAQRVKHRVSRVLHSGISEEDIDPKDLEVVERMTLAANAIVKELGRTFYAHKSKDKDPLGGIYLSGGTSKIKGFDRFLSDQLEVPVNSLRLDETSLKISSEVSENMEIVPQSLAIGLRAVSTVQKHSQVNLRKGEFAYSQNYESILKGAASASKVIAVVLLLLIVTYFAKYYFYKSQIDNLQTLYKKEFLASFPELKKKYRRAKNTSFKKLRYDAERKLKRAISERRTALSEFELTNNSSGAVKILQEISKAIPEDVLIDATLFEFKSTLPGKGKLIFRAETDNFTSQSTIIEALRNISILKDVVEKSSGAKPGSDGKKIEFVINANFEA